MAKITKELAAGRHYGPFSQGECSHYLGGPFQTSSVSLAPKPPDGWRFIQDASFPIKDATQPSINSQIDSDDWPCTWAGIAVAIWQVLQLPITAQAGARDVRSAYRTIPLHPAQWPAAVVQWDGKFYVDKALAFGISSSAGAWGVVGDALADVLRAHGVGPVLKWVDDFLFFRVPRQHLSQLNHAARLQLYAKVQPTRRGGSIYWTDGEHQLCEDFRRPLRDLEGPADWAYSFADVDRICAPLGVPWSEEKEQHFGPSFTYYGVEFSIPDRIISLPDRKRAGLVDKIRSWRASPSHTRDEAESLLGKLQFATHVVPNGRQYLTGLVNFLRMHARSSDRRAPARRSFARPLSGLLPVSAATSSGGARSLHAPPLHDHFPTTSVSTTPAYSPTLAALVLAWSLLIVLRHTPSTHRGERGDGTSCGRRQSARSSACTTWSPPAHLTDLCVYTWTTPPSNPASVTAACRTRPQTSASSASSTSRPFTTSSSDRLASLLRTIRPTDRPVAPRQLCQPSLPSQSLPSSGVWSAGSTRSGAADAAYQRALAPARKSSSTLSHARSMVRTVKTDFTRRQFTPRVAPVPHTVSQLSPSTRLRACLPASTADRYIGLEDEQLARVMEKAFAPTTLEGYGCGLDHFLDWCEAHSIAEEECFPASEELLCRFVASRAGSYSGDSISKMVSAIGAWHKWHGHRWNFQPKSRLTLALRGAAAMTPASSRRPPREPYTTVYLRALRAHFNLSVPRDAAVWACALCAFWGLLRVGEAIVPTQKTYSPEMHISRSGWVHQQVPHHVPAAASASAALRLPWTKTTRAAGAYG